MPEDIRDSIPMLSRSCWRRTFNSLVSRTESDINRRTLAVVASSAPISACLLTLPISDRASCRSDLLGLLPINPLTVTILVLILSILFCSLLDSLHSTSSSVVTCNCERICSLIMSMIVQIWHLKCTSR